MSLTKPAFLASLGVVGLSAGAHASTTTVFENLGAWAGNTHTDIFLDNSSVAQFTYSTLYQPYTSGYYSCGKYCTQYWHNPERNEAWFSANENSGIYSGVGSPSIDPSLNYHPGFVITLDHNSDQGFLTNFTGYINMTFLNGAGVRDYGYATFSNGNLVSVTYQSVPGPAAGAGLPALIAGLGLAGLAMRGRRRNPPSLC